MLKSPIHHRLAFPNYLPRLAQARAGVRSPRSERLTGPSAAVGELIKFTNNSPMSKGRYFVRTAPLKQGDRIGGGGKEDQPRVFRTRKMHVGTSCLSESAPKSGNRGCSVERAGSGLSRTGLAFGGERQNESRAQKLTIGADRLPVTRSPRWV